MEIRTSHNIDAHDCAACKRRRDWSTTIDALKEKLRAHNVTWPRFVIMHGKDKTCAAALTGSGSKDRGLYLVAVDSTGKVARQAKVFARKDPCYAGVTSILKETAF